MNVYMLSVYKFKETIEKFDHHARIPSSLVGTIVKNHPLMEPISLQDLENSAHSQTWKKNKIILLLQVPQF